MLFSIIIPSYNRADLFSESLNSIKKQSYRPIEIILIDDGSTDNTKEVVTSWAAENTEGDNLSLKYIYQENAGAGAARNRGIREITGEYVQFLDSDDLLHPNRLELAAQVFIKSGCEFIETGFEGFCAECGEVIEKHYGHTITDAIILLLIGRLGANTLRSVFHRNLVSRVGPWNEQMTCFEDYEYVTRAVLLSKGNKAIGEILASARRGGSERISDRLKTYEGRISRIHCEKIISEGMRYKTDIPENVICKFVGRLYMLGVRTNANGWSDLGKRCCAIADSLDINLDFICKLKRLLCRMGKFGAVIYGYLIMLHNIFLPKNSIDSVEHTCKSMNWDS